jgi:transposase
MSEIKSRRKYDIEFKKDAVRLSLEPDKSVPEVAKGLGIKPDILNRWKREQTKQGTLAFPGNGIEALAPEQKRIRELEKKLNDAEMERDILKKAVGIFSRLSK